LNTWEKAQGRITKAWSRGDYEAALSELDALLQEPAFRTRDQALLYSGLIKEDRGDLAGAMKDWEEALNHTEGASYSRYVSQRHLGAAYEKVGPREEAMRWYREALRTCAENGEFAGGVALQSYLELNRGMISRDDLVVVEAVVRQSWEVLDLPGEPDLGDLATTIGVLAKRAMDPD
jgi:tetratricopeptide (TPR) repeat protein